MNSHRSVSKMKLAVSLAAVVLGLWGAVARGEVPETLIRYMELDGKTVEVELRPKTMAKYGLDRETYTHLHYNLFLTGNESSEGRATFIDGAWQGMLLHNGRVINIRDLAESPQPATREMRYVAAEIPPGKVIGQCGDAPEIPGTLLRTLQQTSHHETPATLGAMLASRINYNSFCNSTVDGVCLVAELSVTFDSLFRTRHFQNNSETQALAILENVDLIFKDNFKIVFNRISLDMAAGDTFTSSTDIEEVLLNVAEERGNDSSRSYDPNPSSLLHFITGRDFTEGGDFAIGLAFVSTYRDYPNDVSPTLCSQLATGTSMVIGDDAREKVALTSLLVSHELGHNFGFEHDGGDNTGQCPIDLHIMTPSLVPGLSRFSGCSFEALGPNIAAINRIESCFDFPADATLVETPGSVASVPSLQPFESRYSVELEKKGTTPIQVTGTLTGSATLSAATLAGQPCTLGNANQLYTCNLNDAQANQEIALTIVPSGPDVKIDQMVSIPSGQDTFETDDVNNILSSTILLPTPGQAPENLAITGNQAGLLLTWQDRASDETGIVVERSVNFGTWSTIANLPADTQRFTDTDLANQTRYTYRVSATFNSGASNSSDEATFLLDQAPVAWIPPPSGGGGGSLNWLSLFLLSLLPIVTNRTKGHH